MMQFDLPLHGELVVDNFAGGGGASIGIERGIGRPIDIAVNHDAAAIAMHTANHPDTLHYQESIWDVDPSEVCKGPVGLAWFSPDCTHFSRARGSVPAKKSIRGLAWVVLRWAALVKPRVIMLENVPEFASWGPLTRKRNRTNHPKPCKLRKALTFKRWRSQLEALGYVTETRELVACDYGAPTIRKRFFMIARRDGRPIEWPEPSHGEGLLPYRTAAECIDWSVPCPSIFERKRPLAEATMKRIAAGLKRYVVDSPDPFIVPITHTKSSNTANTIAKPLRTITTARGGEFALVAAFMAKHYGGMVGTELRNPTPTATARSTQNQVVTSHLVHLRNHSDGKSVLEPVPTLTASGRHLGEVRAFLLKYYGTANGQDLKKPLHSATSKARFGLVTIEGEDYQIVDIGMRMLQPHELFAAQGFPSDYNIKPILNGKPITKTLQIKLCGNSVCPQWSEALVKANFRHERRSELVA